MLRDVCLKSSNLQNEVAVAVFLSLSSWMSLLAITKSFKGKKKKYQILKPFHLYLAVAKSTALQLSWSLTIG